MALPGAHLREIFESEETRGWEWTTVGNVLLNIRAGKSLKCEERPATPQEWGVLKVSAVSRSNFKPDENKAVPPSFEPPVEYEVQPGDLLISRANTTELVGAVVLVKKTRPHLMLSDKTLRLEPNEDAVAKSFLQLALRTPIAREFIESNATGTSDSMKNISQDVIRSIPIPLPPLATQHALVHQLEGNIVEINRLQQQAERQRKAVEVLPEALLREVFG
jgi:type I restriction enzyme, S subunit